MSDKTTIAIAVGDPAGIGPEISLKAALDREVRDACNPIIVSDPRVIERHARACGIALDLHVIAKVADADWSGHRLNVLDCPQPGAASLDFGKSSDGMTVLRVESEEEARTIASRDPFVLNGIRTFDIREWLVMEGSFAVKVNYSDRSIEMT